MKAFLVAAALAAAQLQSVAAQNGNAGKFCGDYLGSDKSLLAPVEGYGLIKYDTMADNTVCNLAHRTGAIIRETDDDSPLPTIAGFPHHDRGRHASNHLGYWGCNSHCQADRVHLLRHRVLCHIFY